MFFMAFCLDYPSFLCVCFCISVFSYTPILANLSVCLTLLCLSIFLLNILTIYTSFSLYLNMYIYLFPCIYLSFYFFLSLLFTLSIYLFLSLSDCLSLFTRTSVFVSLRVPASFPSNIWLISAPVPRTRPWLLPAGDGNQ